MSEVDPRYSAIEKAMSYDERIERAFRQLKDVHREGFIRVLIEAVGTSDANEVRRLTLQLERVLHASSEGSWMAAAMGAQERAAEVAAEVAERIAVYADGFAAQPGDLAEQIAIGIRNGYWKDDPPAP